MRTWEELAHPKRQVPGTAVRAPARGASVKHQLYGELRDGTTIVPSWRARFALQRQVLWLNEVCALCGS